MGDEVVETMPTHELMSWLSEAERDRFVKLQETFESDGWKLLVQYAQAKVFEHGVLGANAPTWEKCQEHRGTREAWDRVSKLADEFMVAFESQARSAQAEAAADADTDGPQ